MTIVFPIKHNYYKANKLILMHVNVKQYYYKHAFSTKIWIVFAVKIWRFLLNQDELRANVL